MSLNIKSESSLFVEKTCRTCCRFDPAHLLTLHPIFDGGDQGEPSPEFVNVFKEFFLWNLQIKPNDGLPQQMCTECLDRFVQVNIFREQVIDSQKLLLSYVNGEINVGENAYVSKINITEEDFSTALIGNKLDDFGEIGYVSPSKLIEYVGSEDEEQLFKSSHQSNVQELDSFEAKESDYVFNHPNQIEIYKDCNETITVVNPKNSGCNNITKCENFGDKGTTSLTRNDIPNANESKSENNAVIQCDVCMKFIPSIPKLKRHTRQFHLRRDYVCSICDKKLEQVTQRNYYYHMKTHRPKEHKCSYCDKAFVQKVHLLNHERIHTREKPYECDECGKKYRQEITLQEHKLSHKDPFPWKCNICEKSFKGRSCLSAHMRCHSDGFQCEVCGARYNHKPSLKKHMLKHTERGDKIFQCKFCFKSFRKPFQLGNHFHTHHLDSSNVKGCYRCAECDLRFENASELIEHRSTHDTIDRPFLCGPCGKCFMKKIHLETHIDMVHLKKKSFSCMHCHKSFFDVSNLNAHLKIHTGQERTQYKCNDCEKNFSSKKSLRVHQFSHSNENRFKCTFCEESFKYRNDLGDHVLNHFRDESDDTIVKEVQNDIDFENNKVDFDFGTEYKLLDSVIEYSV